MDKDSEERIASWFAERLNAERLKQWTSKRDQAVADGFQAFKAWCLKEMPQDKIPSDDILETWYHELRVRQ
jgi:hypothetical protein